MSMESPGQSGVDCIRTTNEDRVLLATYLDFTPCVMGWDGRASAGRCCPGDSVSALKQYMEASAHNLEITRPFGYQYELSIDANRMNTAIKLANRLVWRTSEKELEYAGMGTTIATILVQGDHLVAGNVGDSRIYGLRGGALEQLRVEYPIIASMLQRGLLTGETSSKRPMCNVLTQAAGSQGNVELHLHESTLELADTILLCSDGLHGVMEEEEISGILQIGQTQEQQVSQLIEAAGAPDNISAIILTIG